MRRLFCKLPARQFGTSKVAAPLIENFRSSWPAPPPSPEVISAIPKRTVPDSALNFEMQVTFDPGMSIFYPHLQTNPADCKVAMTVDLQQLELSDNEKVVFIEMVGKRYNRSKNQVRFVSRRFPNRIENKRHLLMQLENLLIETRNIAANHL